MFFLLFSLHFFFFSLLFPTRRCLITVNFPRLGSLGVGSYFYLRQRSLPVSNTKIMYLSAFLCRLPGGPNNSSPTGASSCPTSPTDSATGRTYVCVYACTGFCTGAASVVRERMDLPAKPTRWCTVVKKYSSKCERLGKGMMMDSRRLAVNQSEHKLHVLLPVPQSARET